MVLKLHMQHDQTLGTQNDKIQRGQESMIAASAKISKTNKIKSFFLQNGLVYLVDIMYEAVKGPWF